MQIKIGKFVESLVATDMGVLAQLVNEDDLTRKVVHVFTQSLFTVLILVALTDFVCPFCIVTMVPTWPLFGKNYANTSDRNEIP